MVNAHDDVTPLRRNRRFQVLWTGSAASSLGARLADTANPLVLLQLTGSPAMAGAYGAVELGATLLCGLHGGAVADRCDRWRVLLAADAVRFLAAGSLTVALTAHQLTLVHALATAAVTGAATAYGGPVRTLAVRAVVPPAQLGEALTSEELRGSTAALLGPPLAGVLLALGEGFPALAVAAGSLVAFATTCLVRFEGRAGEVGGADSRRGDAGGEGWPPATGRSEGCGEGGAGREVGPADFPGSGDDQLGEGEGEGEGEEDREVDPVDFSGSSGGRWAGLRVLFSAPVLRATMGVAVPINLVGAAMVLTVIVLLRDRGVGGAGTGLALAGEAVGAIAGTFLVGRLHRLARPGRLLLGAAWLGVPLLLAPLLPGGALTVFLALAVMNLAMPALRVMLDVLIFRQVPDELRGRVIAATLTTVMLGIPAGTLGVGLLLGRFSPGGTLGLLALVLAVALLPATASRALWRAEWPR